MNRTLQRYGPALALGAGFGLLVVALGGGSAAPSSFEGMVKRAGDVAQLDRNFVPFATAVAYRESRFNPKAANTKAVDRDAACELYHLSEDLYAQSPYGAGDFCWGSGGLYGLIPATGLKPQVFRNRDPALVFDPAASTAMFVDFVVRIVRDYFPKLPENARTWLSVRRAMASLHTMYGGDGTARGREVKDRLVNDLQAVGADPDLIYDHPRVGNYPGAAAVWSALAS